MALSGSFDYTINKRQAISDALIEAGVISDFEPMSDSMYDWMDRRLNLLIKFLQTKGLNTWRTKEATLTMEKGRNTYKLGQEDGFKDEAGNKAPKPQKIGAAYYSYPTPDGLDNTTIQLTIISQEEYYNLSYKDTEGSFPNSIYFRQDIDYTEIRVWFTPETEGLELVMLCQYPFDDLSSTTDNFSFPSWWLEPIHLSLSYVAARGYNAPTEKQTILRADRDIAIMEARDYDSTMEPDIFFVPEAYTHMTGAD